KIHNGASCILGQLPVLAGKVLVGGKESKVSALELVARYRLDEGNLILDLIEAAQRFVIVKQLDVHGGKVLFFQNLLQLFPFKCRSADDSNTKQVAPFLAFDLDRVLSLHLVSGSSL